MRALLLLALATACTPAPAPLVVDAAPVAALLDRPDRSARHTACTDTAAFENPCRLVAK